MAAEDIAQADDNHPSALRMGVIAGMSHNIIIGTIFGTAGVLLQPMQHRMHMPPDVTSVGEPLVLVGSAIVATVAGVLAGRYSLRLLLAVSAAMATVAWLILAFSASFLLYVIAYGLFLGPAMAMAGSVLPPTLVTRWFNRRRGLALGLVHLPILVTIMPVAINWVIEKHGIEAAFLVLAAICGLVLLPATLLVVDRPPGEARLEALESREKTGVTGGLNIWQILRHRRFWAIAVAVGAINTSSVILSIHLVSMAQSWDISRSSAATLASTMSLAGIAGSVLFGWITDRIGGGRTLALIALDAGALWLLFLADLPFAGLMAVTALIGLHGSGAIPSLSRSLAEVFGRENFSRAFGLATTVTLPVTLIGAVGTGTVYKLNGNYIPAILLMVAYFAVAIPLALYASRSRGRAAPA